MAITSLAPLVVQAATISVDAAGISSTTVGSTVDVFFRIEDLSAAAGDSLSGFDIDVEFDEAVIGLSSFSFIDAVTGINQLDLVEPSSFGFFGDATATSSVADAFGISGNSATVLDTMQADAFTFLVLSFDTLAESVLTTVNINLADPNLSLIDSSGADLPITFGSTGASFAVTAPNAVVPAPAASFLLALGLLVMRSTRLLRVARASLLAALLTVPMMVVGTAMADESAWEPVSGEVLQVKGSRLLIETDTGQQIWVTLSEPSAVNVEGSWVEGRLVVGGDIPVLDAPVWTR